MTNGKPDYVKINKFREIGEEIKFLDLNNEEDLKKYQEKKREIMIFVEGREAERYIDGKGKYTVGVGFNMDQVGAKKEWSEAFEHLKPEDRPDFEKVYNLKAKLTDEQIEILYQHSAKVRECDVRNRYIKIWDKLMTSEKLAIEDCFFNAGNKVVGIYEKRKTNFYKQMHLYIEAKERGDYEKALLHFKYARWELKCNSNPEKELGIQNRRDSQEAMLDTYKDDILQENEIKQKLIALEEKRKLEGALDPRGEAFLSIIIGGSIAIAGYNFFIQRTLDRCRGLVFLWFAGKGYSTTLQVENTITHALYASGAYHKDREKYLRDKKKIINLVEETWDELIRKSDRNRSNI